VPGLGGKGFDVPNIPMLAEGGIVTSATLAMIGEKGPEAVIPLDRMGQMGGGTTVNINVNGGDPQSVVNALRTYMRQNGSVPIRVSNIF
jgi:SLT domain-containing protein